VKSDEEIMEILEAYDLTGSFRDAAELAGCSHHTVAHWVNAREQGRLTSGRAEQRPMLIDNYLPKLEEWVEHSRGRIRADVAHDKLIGLGYGGSERTTRRAVAQAKRDWRAGRRRVHRPWIPEPGMWMQYDFGTGPRVNDVVTQLFCAWLAWCRFRVVIALLDKTLPSVMAAIDTTLRIIGGVPTYCLTDNEKTVTSEHVAGIPVRNRQMLDFAHHYGLTIATCVPADPASKGGSENAVKVAKADLVPTDANLLPEYASFAELQQACTLFCEQVNTREHRITRRAPVEMLAEERTRLHTLPAHPYTAAFGLARTVPANTPMITFEHGQYSVPHALLGKTVWVRPHGEQVVVVHVGDDGPIEVARHLRATPGSPRVNDAHFPPQPEGPLNRTPRPTTQEEARFLALGQGAALWLTEAAGAGCAQIRAKMAQALDLAALHDRASVDRALGQAGTAGRFAQGDLAAILAHQASDPEQPIATQSARAGEHNSLAQGTNGWARLGAKEAN
jgi:hypothetical protein